MALNKLVGGDCGGNNSLVKLSNILNRDASASFSQSDRFVNEFMAQSSQMPDTFNMKELLNNMSDVEKANINTNKQITQLSSMNQAQNNNSHMRMLGPSSFMPGPSMMRPFPLQTPHNLTLQPSMSSNIQIQYINESDLQSASDSDSRAKAQEYVNIMQEEDERAYNKFMSFMNRISAGELVLSDDEKTHGELVDELSQNLKKEWAKKFGDEWAKLSNVQDYWDSEAANGIPDEYTFTEKNVMMENKSALEIGKEKLKMGDIPGAALCFEAAVQQQSDSAEAWFLLGTTQAENEQDPLAITALKKSLEIDPRQLEAYITLAAAYTNESMPKHAFYVLVNWLKASPKYSDIIPQDVDIKTMLLNDLEPFVTSLYLKAAQLNPSDIDPDVQNALGVIFNIKHQYDKAVDCFKAALTVASDNAKLWNRLGATLANSEKSEEAVEAYHRALYLEPGFIRARYNVGITCMNLGAHREAAEHFLVALNQQHKSRLMHPDSTADNSSSTIWTTLRMVCSLMGEHDIGIKAEERKLDELNKFFEMGSME